MRMSRHRLLRVILAAALVALIAPASVGAQGSPQRVIVMFKAGQSAAAKGRLVALGAQQGTDLPLIRGAALTLPAGITLAQAAGISGVAHVEPDGFAYASAKTPAPQPAQVLPWGVDRVEADLAWSAKTGVGVKVAVVDTGIDSAHPDLLANLKGGYNAISPTKSWADDNGHGTHVAGTIAAVSNSIGVVGVAPSASLYAVKVLSRGGVGRISDIVAGIQWAVTNDMDVINMSLGGSGYSEAFDTACQNAIDAGVVIVAAAGNSGPDPDTVEYPAKFARVIGVSAIDDANAIASFSSRGDGVDIAAPGVRVFSTYKGKTYATLSGTSMASPHVAGVAALVLTTAVGSDDADADGTWDPVEVQARLARTAQDLGDTGFDSNYGAGLVRADQAVGAH